MPDAVIPSVDSPQSLELKAVREELSILHDIFGTLKNGQMRAIDWPRAKAVLDYVEGRINPLQARADELTPVPLALVSETAEAAH